MAKILSAVYSIFIIYIACVYQSGHPIPAFEWTKVLFFPSVEWLKYLFFLFFLLSAHNYGAIALFIPLDSSGFNGWLETTLRLGAGFIIVAALITAKLAAGLCSFNSFASVLLLPFLIQAAVRTCVKTTGASSTALSALDGNFFTPSLFKKLAREISESVARLAANDKTSLTIGAAAFSIIAFGFVFSALPQTGWDALSYQMEIPKQYLQRGRLFFPKEIYFWGYPQLLNSIYSLFIFFKFETLCSSFHAIFNLLTVTLIINFPLEKAGLKEIGTRCRTAAALLVAAHPQALLMASYAFVDLGLMFYFTAACLFLLRGDVYLTAVFLGGALSAKYTGLMMSAVLFFTIIFFRRGGELKKNIVIAVRTMLIAYFIFSPYCIKNFAFTGNPFYPFFKYFFNTETVSYDNLESYLEVLNRLGREKTPANLALFPLTITTDSQYYGIRCYDGVMGITFLAMIPFYLYAITKLFNSKNAETRTSSKAVFFIFAIYYLFVLRAQSTRYFLPALPLFYIAASYGLEWFAKKNFTDKITWRAAVTFALVISCFNAYPAFVEFVKKEPAAYLSGYETKESFLDRNLPVYSCATAYNEILKNSTGEIMLAPLYEPRTYYFNKNYTWNDVFEPTPFEDVETIDKDGNITDHFPFKTPGELKKHLAAKKITHMLIGKPQLKQFLSYIEKPDDEKPPKPERKELFSKFLKEEARLIHQKNGYALYSINL